MDKWKSRGGKSHRRERKKKEDQRNESEERRCCAKSEAPCFSNAWGSGGSKRRLAKEAGAEPSGQMRNQKAHTTVARNRCRSQNE